MSEERCDLCGRAGLEAVYAATPSPRGLSVWLCPHCALVQSLPRIDHVASRTRAPSAGADWGNIRYGKGFRTAETFRVLAPYLDPQSKPVVLDVGANRGSFLETLLARVPGAHILAVEPDNSVVGAYKDRPGLELIPARIEAVDLASDSVDVIHSCHTFEHLRSPHTTLADHWRVLKPGGLLYAEVPNLALLASPDLVEEWFIDKHLYHFSADVFVTLIESSGFSIVVPPDPKDETNVAVLARKSIWHSRPDVANPREVLESRSLLAAYKANRAKTAATMSKVADRLTSLSAEPLAIWGAGRLLNALIETGGFDPHRAIAIVDTYLAQHGLAIAGRKVSRPDDLKSIKPRVIVIMSRLFETEIMRDARAIAPGAKIFTYSDLFRSELAEV